jgi:hypothetical protein
MLEALAMHGRAQQQHEFREHVTGKPLPSNRKGGGRWSMGTYANVIHSGPTGSLFGGLSPGHGLAQRSRW